jgi:hypothetical protein
MINRPTVLILGAGASAHLGYPTGNILVEKILKALDNHSSPEMPLFENFGWTTKALEFKEALSFSSRSSVDAFLEHRAEYIDVGKLAIAQQLIKSESMEKLFERNDDNWYQYLFEQLNASFENFGDNRLSVVTFNYDRSFEQYLFTALKHSYGKDDDEVVSQLSRISIVHVHGVLGKLPWQDPSGCGREYEKTEHKAHIKKSSDAIKIIHEGIEGDTEFTEAQKLIDQAKRLLFLGFGFHKTNVARLGINWSNRMIMGTGFGLTETERNHVQLRCGEKLKLFDLPVLSFLREKTHLSD